MCLNNPELVNKHLAHLVSPTMMKDREGSVQLNHAELMSQTSPHLAISVMLT